MFQKRYLIICLLLPVLVCVSACAKKSLSLEYQYSSEGSSEDIKIEGSKITYVHTDYEKIKERCAQWIQQAPCWTEEDLITEESQLTEEEISNLSNLVEETRIMQLDSYYGPSVEARCYSHILKIQKKEINYCNGFDSPERPVAFGTIEDQLQKIVAQKFQK